MGWYGLTSNKFDARYRAVARTLRLHAVSHPVQLFNGGGNTSLWCSAYPDNNEHSYSLRLGREGNKQRGAIVVHYLPYAPENLFNGLPTFLNTADEAYSALMTYEDRLYKLTEHSSYYGSRLCYAEMLLHDTPCTDKLRTPGKPFYDVK